MSNHSTGSGPSQQLCDDLLAKLQAQEPGATRSSATGMCALRGATGPNLAYAIHRKKLPTLDIYFPSTPADTFLPAGSLVPTLRNKLGNNWADRYAWHFSLSPESTIDDAARFLLRRRSSSRNNPTDDTPLPEEIPSDATFSEGAARTVTINAYERSPKARARCIEHWGAICAICGFDFGRVYGPEFSGFIHVHHVVPLSNIRRSYRLNPIRDLRPVCPNCHAAIHHARAEPLSIDELRKRLCAGPVD